MSQAIISVRGLGKRYRIGGRRDAYFTLRDSLAGAAGRLAEGLGRSSSRGAARDFWALKDASFEVGRGEVVGVIGRNGAGKSTLLKLLSRITEPSEGRAVLRGRVGSLLEVGTGFHAELTGRENIYMSGAILGMSKAEIDRQFDEIAAFAGVEEFLDTPCKRYSSGMYVRLGFAVAAHLDPEILLVDEVLAVGDAEFQKKCLGKMSEVARGGRTILFVSHNMAAVENLCGRALLLDRGRIVEAGDSRGVIARYVEGVKAESAPGGGPLAVDEARGVTFRGVGLLGEDGRPAPALRSGRPGALRLSFACRSDVGVVAAVIGVNSWREGTRICALASGIGGGELRLSAPGTELICRMPRVPLSPGRYRLMIKIIAAGEAVFYLPDCAEFDVEGGDFFGNGRLPGADWGGLVFVDHEWASNPVSTGETA